MMTAVNTTESETIHPCPRAVTTRILAVFANPLGTDPLRLSAEDRTIRDCIARSRHRRRIRVETLHAVTIHDVRRALLEQEYNIVHFSGHGAEQGLVLEDEVGRARGVPPDALADLLAAYAPPLQCAIFNACYTGKQGRLLAARLPFVVVSDGSIADTAAVEFARGFYDAIGAGKGIAFAYEEGCRTVRLTGHAPSALPCLIRGGTTSTVAEGLA